MGSSKALAKTKEGFAFSIMLAGDVKRKWPARKKLRGKGMVTRREHVVKEYAHHYASAKAPGLGSFSTQAHAKIADAASKAFFARMDRTWLAAATIQAGRANRTPRGFKRVVRVTLRGR
jgi:hypothetical protein